MVKKKSSLSAKPKRQHAGGSKVEAEVIAEVPQRRQSRPTNLPPGDPEPAPDYNGQKCGPSGQRRGRSKAGGADVCSTSVVPEHGPPKPSTLSLGDYVDPMTGFVIHTSQEAGPSRQDVRQRNLSTSKKDGLNQSSYDGLSSIVRTSQVAGLTIPRGQLAGTETGAVPKIKPMPGSRGTKGAGLNVEIPVHEGRRTRSSTRQPPVVQKDVRKANKLEAQAIRRRRQRDVDPLPPRAYSFNERVDKLPDSNIGYLIPVRQGGRQCPHCKALLFIGETSSLCCHQGTTQLPPIETPPELMELFQTPRFLSNLRRWNNAFALASMTVDKEVGPPADGNRFAGNVKIQGKLYHQVGHVNAPEGLPPVFLQLYFIDTEQAMASRTRVIGQERMDLDMLETLTRLIESVNPYIRDLKTALEVIRETDVANGGEGICEAHIVIAHDRSLIPPDAHKGTYNVPQTSEVAGIILGDQQLARSRHGVIKNPDIILHYRPNAPRRLDLINTTHRSYDPLLYVLFFPCGEDGWHRYLKRQVPGGKRDKLTEADFYAYRIQVRNADFNVITRGRRLFQMYLIDQWAKIEAHRLKYVRDNQAQLRGELYTVMLDAINDQDFVPDQQLGNRFILPPSIYGSQRFWKKLYHDAMAIVRQYGKPDYFVTMTCNPHWEEVKKSLRVGENSVDRPDLCARGFFLKHQGMKEDVVKQGVLGKVVAFVESVEFQKRGLPHTHLILWVRPADKPLTREIIDANVSAELPDRNTNPLLHEQVKTHMVHGPCGVHNRNLLCMQDERSKTSTGNRCAKMFPKPFLEETKVMDGMYPEYKRRAPGTPGGHHFVKTKANGESLVIDNQWVVPYNPKLLLKYQCHINVEVVNTTDAIKYIMKYVTKGQDRTTFHVEIVETGTDVPRPPAGAGNQGPPPGVAPDTD